MARYGTWGDPPCYSQWKTAHHRDHLFLIYERAPEVPSYTVCLSFSFSAAVKFVSQPNWLALPWTAARLSDHRIVPRKVRQALIANVCQTVGALPEQDKNDLLAIIEDFLFCIRSKWSKKEM